MRILIKSAVFLFYLPLNPASPRAARLDSHTLQSWSPFVSTHVTHTPLTLTSHQRQFNFFSFFSLLLFSSFNRAPTLLWEGPDRCGAPSSPKNREKSERLICPPADVGFGSLEASPLTCPSFGGGSRRTLAAASCHLLPTEDALHALPLCWAKRRLTRQHWTGSYRGRKVLTQGLVSLCINKGSYLWILQKICA